jgi:hypothetical protein
MLQNNNLKNQARDKSGRGEDPPVPARKLSQDIFAAFISKGRSEKEPFHAALRVINIPFSIKTDGRSEI